MSRNRLETGDVLTVALPVTVWMLNVDGTYELKYTNPQGDDYYVDYVPADLVED